LSTRPNQPNHRRSSSNLTGPTRANTAPDGGGGPVSWMKYFQAIIEMRACKLKGCGLSGIWRAGRRDDGAWIREVGSDVWRMIRVKMGNAGEQVCTGWINCAWVGEKPLKLKRFYTLDEVHPAEALVITHILGSLMPVLLFCKDSKPRRVICL
jgi:hypothetical protein